MTREGTNGQHQAQLAKKLRPHKGEALDRIAAHMYDWLCGYEAGYGDQPAKPAKPKTA